MKYSIIIVTVLGLLVKNVYGKEVPHFNVFEFKSICQDKLKHLKDLATSIKSKLDDADKDVVTAVEETHKYFTEMLTKSEESCKEVVNLAKEIAKGGGSKKLTKEEEEDDGTPEKVKTEQDAKIYEWIDSFHVASIAFKEVDYKLYFEFAKRGDLSALENYIKNYKVESSGFLKNIVSFAFLVPVLLVANQLA